MDYTVKDFIFEHEKNYLSEFACLSSETRGREHPTEDCDIRTDFQRDRDRIIHSKSFRRLMHKTQVFLAPEADHYRTRLTHTLEVTQIARTIARALRLNEDLTEAIALGHDLGHTPFGHEGERVLQRCYDENFRHYLQSIRVVEKLEDGGKGLNLTWEVRDGILNHTNGKAATLEGRVVKISDRIAYINHDIDDACRGGIISPDDIDAMIHLKLGATHGERIDSMVKSVINSSTGKDDILMDDETNEYTDMLHEFLFERVYRNSAAKTEEGKASSMLETLYHFFVDNPDMLPLESRRTLEEEGKERAVCDFISGMTDRYAVSVYKELFIPKSWKKESLID